MNTRIVAALALLSILLSLGLAPAGANADPPRPRGIAALLGLQAIANYRGDRGEAASEASQTADVPTSWQFRTPAPPPSRAAGTLTYLRDLAGNHNLWYIGGVIDVLGNVTGEVSKYDAVRNTWTIGFAPMAFPAAGHCAVAIGRRIFVIGGSDAVRTVIGVQAYDTTTNTWSTNYDPLPSAYPNGLALHGCAATGNTIYVFGGGDPVALVPFGLTFAFRPNRPLGHQWTQLGFTMVHPRAGFGYAVDRTGRKVYTAGGSDTWDSFSGLPNEVPYVEVFSPSTGWSSLPDMPFNRTGAALFLNQTRTTLTIAGGGVLSPTNATYQCTLPACSTWTSGSNLNNARSSPASVGIRNFFFVTGGVSGTFPFITFLNTVELGP